MSASATEMMSRDELTAVIAELRQGWDQFCGTDLELTQPRDATMMTAAPVVVGLASHVMALAEAVVTLLDQSTNELVAMPLVRAAFEGAITAHWIAQVPDGMQAFAEEQNRSRRVLIADLEKTRSEVFRIGANNIATQVFPTMNSSSSGPVRYFSQMCDDLEIAGADAYVYYRLASQQAHPSLFVADQYFESTKNGVALRTTPRATVADSGWLFLTAASVVWAQMAVNYCDAKRLRRNELRAIGRKLGIEAELTISGGAWVRVNKK